MWREEKENIVKVNLSVKQRNFISVMSNMTWVWLIPDRKKVEEIKNLYLYVDEWGGKSYADFPYCEKTKMIQSRDLILTKR